MIDIKQVASSYRPIDVIRALGLEGEERGKRFFALNPTRDDATVGSFYIDLQTGYFTDKSTNDWGGDVVALWAYCRRINTMGAAAKELQETLKTKRLSDPLPKPEPRERTHGELVIPAIVNAKQRIPTDTPSSLPNDPTVYVYSGLDGISTLGLVYRWDLPDGSKQIRQRFMFVPPGGSPSWRWAGPTGDDNRPLYRLERLKPRPSEVWIVEGEKTADAAQTVAPDGVAVLSWLGGCTTAEKVDVSNLRGIPCVLIPDRDAQEDKSGELLPYAKQPGVAAMNAIAVKLLALGNRVGIVDYTPGDSTHGWDLADAVDEGWTSERVVEMIRSSTRQLPPAKKTDERPENFGEKDLYLPLRVSLFKLAGNGKPLNVWHSYATMLNAYGITCRENEMTQKVEMIHEKTQQPISREEILSLAVYNQIPTANIKDHLTVISAANKYHPVVDWIKSRPWDGKSRMAEMFGSITIGDSNVELSAKLFFRWCISAVALATQERMDITGAPPAAQGVLVLVGSQDLNKSRWVSSLAPAEFVRPGVVLDIDDKDSLIKSTTSWIVEWAELTGSKNPTKLARVKAHVTGAVEFIRKPYAAEAVERARRTVYIGTENNDDYLMDSTGNRRWWTIRVNHLNVEHGVDTQQFWAEVYDAFQKGAPWWLVDDEKSILAESNTKHEAICTVEDLLYGGLRWDEAGRSWETASSLMAQLGRHCSPADAKRVIGYMRRRGCVIDDQAGKSARILSPIARSLR